MASEAGKGSKQRPTDQEKFSTNYDLIFGKKPPKNNQQPATQKKESE